MPEPIAPPESKVEPVDVEKVDLSAPVKKPGDVVTFQDLPPVAKEILTTATTNPSRAADLVKQTNNEQADYHPNEQAQWGKVLFSALARDYGGVYKYFNGGAKTEEKGFTPLGDVIWAERNELGPTGRYKDVKGNVLNAKDVIKMGGVITPSDEQAMKTSSWKNIQENSELANKGFQSEFNVARQTALVAANTASASNHNIDEQVNLAKKNRKVLDYISTLPPEKRANLLGNVSRMINVSRGAQSSATNAGSATSGSQAGTGWTAGGGLGGKEGGASVAGTLGVNANAGLSGNGSNQTSATNSQNNSAATSANNSLVEQQSLASAIIGELQTVLGKDPNGQAFKDFLRLHALNMDNEAELKKIPEGVKPPGYENIPETDPYLGGAEAMITNRTKQQANNALLAAYTKGLYQAQREALRTGESIDLGKIQADFQQSPIYKAILNTYSDRLNAHLGKERKLKLDDLIVDQSNRVRKVSDLLNQE